MERDLAICLVALDVIVDDFSQSGSTPCMPAQRSASEGLGLGLAAQWRSGVPWQSEPGIMRYVRKQLRHVCPPVRTQRACHRRLRRLWGACILLQDVVAAQCAQGDEDVRDGFPMPVAQGARSAPWVVGRHRLAWPRGQ